MLLTVRDVAKELQCSQRKAREIMLSLPHVRVGKLLRIRPAVLERWAEAGGDQYAGATRARPANVVRFPRPTPLLRVPVAKRRARAS